MQAESLSRALKDIEQLADNDVHAYRTMMDSLGLNERVRGRLVAEIGGEHFPDVIFGMAAALLAQRYDEATA